MLSFPSIADQLPAVIQKRPTCPWPRDPSPSGMLAGWDLYGSVLHCTAASGGLQLQLESRMKPGIRTWQLMRFPVIPVRRFANHQILRQRSQRKRPMTLSG